MRLPIDGDILSTILLELDICDVLALSQVSRAVRDLVMLDKRCWAKQARHIARRKQLQPPSHFESQYEESPSDLRQRLQHAVALQDSLQNGNISSSISFEYEPKLPVTWLQLFRGRWLITAGSDSERSIIFCHDLFTSDGVPHLKARLSLPGPVTSGSMDDVDGKCVIALSIEVWPIGHALILSLSPSAQDQKIRFIQEAQIDGISYIKFLKGDLLGCSVYNNNDYRCWISNWTNGSTAALIPDKRVPITDPEERLHGWMSPQYHMGAGFAMTFWKKHCFVAHNGVVCVYSVSAENGAWRHIQSLAVYEWPVLDAEFSQPTFAHHDVSSRQGGDTIPATEAVLLITRNQGSTVHLHWITEVNATCSFRVEADPLSFKVNAPFIAMNLGDVGQALAWVDIGENTRPKVRITRIERTSSTVRSHSNSEYSEPCSGTSFKAICWDGSEIHSEDLPLLSEYPVLALDDMRGILAVATREGKLAVMTFCSLDWIRATCGDLPSVEFHNGEVPDPSTLQVSPYAWPFLSEDDVQNPGIVAEVIKMVREVWDQYKVERLPEGWSNDWESCPILVDLLPDSERHYDRQRAGGYGLTQQLRDRYSTFGIPVPLLYRRATEHGYEDAFLLLFRIGESPYFYLSQEPGVYGLRGQISRVVLDPDEIFARVEDCARDIRLDMDGAAFEDLCHLVQSGKRRAVLCGKDQDPAKWSDEDWATLSEWSQTS